MKVVYKKSIVQQLVEVRHAADSANKKIDHVKLSEEEVQQLFRESFSYPCCKYSSLNDLRCAISSCSVKIVGIKLARLL